MTSQKEPKEHCAMKSNQGNYVSQKNQNCKAILETQRKVKRIWIGFRLAFVDMTQTLNQQIR
jgi:hypothetical protein